ncbi:DoxX family protein [Coraliomargarita algicola]|uniref:DoxX family protein n=1 Tax=Coraliomargarita algicola TaxID=3092156 RepID=A0ABZ0RIP3_9BACT|nr:DoxX family protein [Coraliomargarita sp. J2-16]WPJ94948.1 DoxX family protein [Coraliomargarita sp. J2-16]
MKAPAYSTNLGLFVLRIGIGSMFILHGLPKLMGGTAAWEQVAQHGLPFLPAGNISIAFGLAAAIAEFGGGILLILGCYHRIVCSALMGTMAVAFSTKLGAVTGYQNFALEAGWPLELLIVFIALFLTGPGRWRIGAGKS